MDATRSGPQARGVVLRRAAAVSVGAELPGDARLRGEFPAEFFPNADRGVMPLPDRGSNRLLRQAHVPARESPRQACSWPSTRQKNSAVESGVWEYFFVAVEKILH